MNPRAASLVAAVLAAGLSFAALAAACGGDDGPDDPTPGPAATPTRPPVAPADLLPDLSADGFTREAPQTLPGPAGFAIAFTVYTRPGVVVRIETRTYPDEAAAQTDFPKQAEGWKAPPAGAVFGADPKNVDGTALPGFDDAVAYVSSRADSRGNRIWTEVLRKGAVLVVMHTLAADETVGNATRAATAEALLAGMP